MKFEGPGWAAFFSEDGTDTGHRVLVSEDWCGGGLVIVCEGHGTNRAKVVELVCDLPYLLQFYGYDPVEPHAIVRSVLLELDGRIRRSGGGMSLSLVHVTQDFLTVIRVGNARATIVGDGRHDDLIVGSGSARFRGDQMLGAGPSSKAASNIDVAVIPRDPSASFLLLGTVNLWLALDHAGRGLATAAISSSDEPDAALDTLIVACDQARLTHCAAVVADLRAQKT